MISLEAINEYLSLKSDEDHSAPVKLFLNAIINNNGDLNILQNVVEISSFKSEIKKKQELTDDKEAIELESKVRRIAGKIVYIISKEIFNNTDDVSLLNYFIKIPNIFDSVVKSLEILHEMYSDDNLKSLSLEQINENLSSLALLVNSEHSEDFILKLSNLPSVKSLNLYIKEPMLKLNTLRIYRGMSKLPSLMNELLNSDEEIMSNLISSLEVNSECILTIINSQKSAAPPGKGKKVLINFYYYYYYYY